MTDADDRSSSVFRPFVPGAPPPIATPSSAEPARPFVPGQANAELPPISRFEYDRTPPIAMPSATPPTRPVFATPPQAQTATVPPPPPPHATPPSPVRSATPLTPLTPSPPAPVQRSGEPWAGQDWQRYDWNSASALAPEETRAAQAWSDLDWDASVRARGVASGEHVARALEALAARIRRGELPVRGESGMTEEAAAAAVLATLLNRRR